MADHPDFEDVVGPADGDGATRISVPMAAAIMQAGEDGPRLEYHLGQNKAEAVRIAALAPLNQAMEMGRLLATLRVEDTPVRRTPKPKPITPVGDRSASNAKDPDEMSTEEYANSIAHRLPFKRRTN